MVEPSSETAVVSLVGREGECARIDRLLDDVTGGESRSLVIRGEPGIGKTSLLDYASRRAAGMMVLRVEGVESDSDLAFAGLFGLLRPVVDRLERLVELQQRALAGALGIAESGSADRFLVSAATLGLLAAVAEDAPLLCLIDDAQWLDVPSAEALVFAARRLRAERTAVVFATRETDEQRFEAAGLAELVLTGVDEGSAERLLAVSMPGAAPGVRSRLLAEAAGNPLALLELPRGLSDAQLGGREALPDALPLTPRLQTGFRRRIERLPEASRLALLIAATDSTGELATVLGAITAMDLEADTLDPAERQGLIWTAELGIGFRHPLVRAAMLERATLSQRQRAHVALASALSGEEHVDRRVWHQAMATITGDEDVAAALEELAERARLRGAHASASTAFERAAALTLDRSRLASRLAAATEAAWTAGQPKRTRELLTRALPLAEGGQPARLLYIRGLLECRHGSPREGIATFLEGVDASDDPALTLELLHEAANTNTMRAQIPPISSPPAIQPTRASATPPLPRRTCVARPPSDAQHYAHAGQRRDKQEVVAGGGDRMHVDASHEEHNRERDENAPEIQPPLARLAENDEHEHCVDEVIASCHRGIIDSRASSVVGLGVEHEG